MTKTTIDNETKESEVQIKSEVAPWMTKLAYPLAGKIIFPWFFKQLQITGQENVPKTGAVIVTPTHRSRWDALVVPYATGRKTSGRDPHFMVSANEMTGIQGWFVRRFGGFPVDTEHPGLDSLRHSIELLSQDMMVVIFPEGNIFRTDEVNPLKRGVAKIALEVEEKNPEVEIKILPVSIKYSEPIPSRGSSISVKIGSCLTIKDYEQNEFSARKNSILLTSDLQTSLQQLHDQNNAFSIEDKVVTRKDE